MRLVALVTLAAGLSTALPWGAGAAADPPAPLAVPLAVSLSAGGRSWVSLAARAGETGQAFWQLLRNDGSGGWKLATPPGVASTGGLVITSAAGTGLLSAFLPSQQLRFTPLARTSGGASGWSGTILPRLVSPLPDALTIAASGTAFALVRSPAVLVSASGALASWHQVASLPGLAASPVARGCAPEALTAVAALPDGSALVGAACGRPGGVGLFRFSGGGWRAYPLELPAGVRGDRLRVLRLATIGNSAAALLLATSVTHRLLFESGTGAAAGRPAAAVAVPSGAHLLSTGLLSPGGLFAVVQGAGGAFVYGPRALRPLTPPPGTSVLAVEPSGAVEAFVARGGELTIERLSAGGSWQVVQRLRVPLETSPSP